MISSAMAAPDPKVDAQRQAEAADVMNRLYPQGKPAATESATEPKPQP